MKVSVFMLLVLVLFAAPVLAQDKVQDAPVTIKVVYSEKAPEDPFKARLIPRNSKVYIATSKNEDPNKPQAQGFETYLAAAMRKKNVPLIIVADRSIADFEIDNTADMKGAGFAKKWLLGDFRRTTSASISMTNLHTGVVAYADASHKGLANRGLRSSAEKLAKYLKRKIEDDEKKMKK